jgi:hypothetical protein
MKTYFDFLKMVFKNNDVRAMLEYAMWIGIGTYLTWIVNPNSGIFNKNNPVGLEILFLVFFIIHGSLRFVYLIWRNEE